MPDAKLKLPTRHVMPKAKSNPKSEQVVVNEIARVLFIADQTIPEGKAFKDVLPDRKRLWLESNKEYLKKARKLLQIIEHRKNLTIEAGLKNAGAEDRESSES